MKSSLQVPILLSLILSKWEIVDSFHIQPRNVIRTHELHPTSSHFSSSSSSSQNRIFHPTLSTINRSSSDSCHSAILHAWKRHAHDNEKSFLGTSTATTTNNDCTRNIRIFQPRILKKHVKSLSISILFALSTWMRSPFAARADFLSSKAPPVRMSLRPGITPEEIKRDMLTKKERESKDGKITTPQYFSLDRDENQQQDISSFKFDESTEASLEDTKSMSSLSTAPKKKKIQQQRRKEEYDDDYFDDEEEVVKEVEESVPNRIQTSSLPNRFKKGSKYTKISSNIKTTPRTVSSSGMVQTVSSLSGSGPKLSQKAETAMIQKAVLIMFGPVVGICFLREADRWNKEQKRVDQRLDVLKIQREEMKKQNQGDSSSEDDKKGDEDDDDDDDEDDDDDDEEDDKQDKKGL